MASLAQHWHQEGLEIGIIQGTKIGEARAMENAAISMLKQNLDVGTITSVTGFTLNKINQLKSSLF